MPDCSTAVPALILGPACQGTCTARCACWAHALPADGRGCPGRSASTAERSGPPAPLVQATRMAADAAAPPAAQGSGIRVDGAVGALWHLRGGVVAEAAMFRQGCVLVCCCSSACCELMAQRLGSRDTCEKRGLCRCLWRWWTDVERWKGDWACKRRLKLLGIKVWGLNPQTRFQACRMGSVADCGSRADEAVRKSAVPHWNVTRDHYGGLAPGLVLVGHRHINRGENSMPEAWLAVKDAP